MTLEPHQNTHRLPLLVAQRRLNPGFCAPPSQFRHRSHARDYRDISTRERFRRDEKALALVPSPNLSTVKVELSPQSTGASPASTAIVGGRNQRPEHKAGLIAFHGVVQAQSAVHHREIDERRRNGDRKDAQTFFHRIPSYSLRSRPGSPVVTG